MGFSRQAKSNGCVPIKFRTYMLRILLITFLLSLTALTQVEVLNNETIIEMSKAGLSADVIFKKISSTQPAFDVSAHGLIELKRSGVDDSIIAYMIERSETVASRPARKTNTATPLPFSESSSVAQSSPDGVLPSARTIAFAKSSLHPSRQALEKELMKRKDFQSTNLSILRYKEQADLFVEIGYVSGSWVTHRYVYRIYDRRSGAVIGAGETTSWGSLAENLARNIAKSLAGAKGKLSGG